MTLRIFTAALATETNTFGPIPTGLPAFHDRGYFPAGRHPDHLTFFAGPLWALRERAPAEGWTVVEGLVAGAQPSGTTTRAAHEALRDELLADLRAALPVDMVLLGLHGAMVAEGCDDCEGDLLTRVRALVGPGVVVGAELDPHTHLSATMVAQADVLIAFKEYPHTDILPRAHELVSLCEAVARGRVRPEAGVADTQAILTLHTSRQPARGFVDRVQALEGQDGILSVSVIHGFPYGDVPDMGTQLLVYADGDAARAQALARQLADELLALRDQLEAAYPDADAAIDQALATPPGPGPVVLADRADNPGSGAPGDATFLLQRLLARGVAPAALGPLWDPAAVRVAFEAGEGAALPMRIGGKTGPASGPPLDLWCRVRRLQPDLVMTGLAGAPMPVGDAALVEAWWPEDAAAPLGPAGGRAGVQIVLISLRNQAMGTDLFTGLGCDLMAQQVVVVKSAQHFHAAFAPLARAVVYVGAPGCGVARPGHVGLPAHPPAQVAAGSVAPAGRGAQGFFLLRSGTSVVIVGVTAPGDRGLGGDWSFLGFLAFLVAALLSFGHGVLRGGGQ